MPILTSEEEKQLLDKKNERKKTIGKFKDDYLLSFMIGIRIGGITLGAAIVIYLTAKWLFKWDLFYETDLKYSSIFLAITIIFMVLVVICWFVAFILYNTKHKRNTKYTDER